MFALRAELGVVASLALPLRPISLLSHESEFGGGFLWCGSTTPAWLRQNCRIPSGTAQPQATPDAGCHPEGVSGDHASGMKPVPLHTEQGGSFLKGGRPLHPVGQP